MLFVRYENMALEPEQTAWSIHRFLGLPVHASALSWIDRHKNDQSDNNPYSTQRNSTEAATGWRLRMPFADVKKIQDMPVCRKSLYLAGYTFFENEEKFKNLSHPLLTQTSTVLKSLD